MVKLIGLTTIALFLVACDPPKESKTAATASSAAAEPTATASATAKPDASAAGSAAAKPAASAKAEDKK